MKKDENIELEDAIKRLLEEITPLKEEKEVEILDSLGFVLSEDIVSKIYNPPFDRSPLDGFTLNHEITKGANRSNPITLTVEKEIMAGEYDSFSDIENAVRIMTGAPIPKGCTAVIRQEDVDFDEKNKKVTIYKELSEYENYCFKGEDLKKGDLLFKKGEKITLNHIGVFASIGLVKVKVYKEAKIGVLCSGDELILPGESLTKGKIYNSNLFSLVARLKNLKQEVKNLPIVRDEPKEVAKLIDEEIADLDLLITTGGVSVGKKDIFHDVIKILNAKRLFWKVNIQPGTPILGSIYKGKIILSLSGNPYASLVNFELVGKPLLNKLTNEMVEKNLEKEAILLDSFPKKSRKRRFVRARYEDGKLMINTTKHSSGQLASMVGKNALIDVVPGTPSLDKGMKVKVVLIDE